MTGAQLRLPGFVLQENAQLRFRDLACAYGSFIGATDDWQDDDWDDPSAPLVGEHLGLLGLHARDIFTGAEGRVAAISFELRRLSFGGDELITSLRFSRPDCVQAHTRFARPPAYWPSSFANLIGGLSFGVIPGGRRAASSGG